MNKTPCKKCGGDGYTVEYDPSDPTGQTPMQVQCPCDTSQTPEDWREEALEKLLKKYDIRYFDGSTYAVTEEYEKDLFTLLDENTKSRDAQLDTLVLNIFGDDQPKYKLWQEALKTITPDNK